ncbi:MAG TPA: Ig-like domain-containing protein, partial [Thermoanaerobaculia bacterium]
PTALVVGPADQPSVTFVSTTPAAGANEPQATPISITASATSIAGIREVRTILDKQPVDVVAYPRFNPNVPDTASSITIPATATTGAASLKVRVTDRAGRTAELAPVAFNVIANSAPVVTAMNVTPATETYAGRSIAIVAAASDDVAVTSLTLTSSIGTVTAQTPATPTQTTMTRDFTVAIPPATPTGGDVTLTLAASDNFPNRAATTRTHTLRILKDTLAPSVAIVQPAANQELQEGSGATFVVEVDAADAEVAVQSVKVMFDGAEHQLTLSGNRWRKTLNVPNVDGDAPVAKTLTVTATDYEANSKSEAVTIYVKPLFDPEAPVLTWVCASPGAMAPAGFETAFRVSAVPSALAGSGNGVNSVAISINGAPLTVTSAGTNLYEARYTIPVGTADGTSFDVRVVARSVGGNESTLVGTLTAVAGTEVSTASVIPADDVAFENLNVIVRSGGVLTVHGAHHLKNLVVLPGGKVVQQHADLMRADLLTVDRLYVACGASVDVTGLGFARNTAAPGVAAPDYQSAGGHIGRGGVAHARSGGSYGSITRPREAGSGGNTSVTNASRGGGVIRMHATAAMTIDGAVQSNGTGSGAIGWGGGAGGSVWLTTAGALNGAGSVEALGANADHIRSTGGGGAIAIEYGTASGTLLSKLSSFGAYTGWGAEGGAGSVYTRGGAAVYGDLLLDNRGNNSKFTVTELPSLGRTSAASVNGASVTLRGKRWLPSSFEGHRVRVTTPDGTTRGTYRIDSITNDANVIAINGFAEIQTQDAIAYDGYIVYSPQGIDGRNFLAARWANERWEYDSGSIFTAFNPRSGESLIASFSKNGSAITAVATFSCEGGCPAAVHGMPLLELSAGEIAANAISTVVAGEPKNLGVIDDAELFLRPDASHRSLLFTRGVDARITLVDEHGGSVNVQAGDTLHGLYLFENVKLLTTTVVTNDLLESANAPVLDATSKLSTGNTAAPRLDAAGVAIERGLYGPVLVAPAGAVSDSDAPLDVVARTTSAARTTPAWDHNWQIFVGDRGRLSLARRPGSEAGPYGISALEAIAAFGYVSFTPSLTNQDLVVALAPNDTTRGETEPGRYGFKLRADAKYEVWANGANANKTAAYSSTTVFRIEKMPNRIRYVVNGVRVHEVTASIPPSLRLDVSMTSENAEIHSLEYDTTSDGASFRATAAANGSFRVPVRGAADTAIVVAARDRHRMALDSDALPAGTIPNNIGVASIALDPSEITGGRTSLATVTLLAPAGSEGALVELTSNHAAATVPPSITIAPNALTGTFTITTTAVAAPVEATIAATYDGNGTSAVARVVKDNIAPVVTITAPAANAQYTEGQTAKIAVQATVTDADSGVKRAFVTLDGVDYPMTAAANVHSAQVPVPFVDGTSDVTKNIVVTAEDNNANFGSANVNVIVHPVVDANAPTITALCGSDGAMYPPGQVARFRYIARGPAANNPIQRVDVTIADPNGLATTTVATAVNGVADAYEITFTIPDVADASAFTVRGLSTSSSGTTAFADSTFRVIKGTEIKASVTIGANDTTYDNKAVVIFPGVTVTIDGAHTFTRLAVLGTLVPVTGKTLDVTADALFVACDATLDATGRGYGLYQTYPGARLPDRVQEAGAHIGRGAVETNPIYAQIGATYGSVYEPREFGGGANRSATGGGAIRIRASSVAIDGAVRANGNNGGGEGAGAGGSVWLSATKVSGGGTVEADGGNACWAGGAGAVAIEYSAAGSTLPLLRARPGVPSCSNQFGGPGVVFERGPQSLFGSAAIDTGGRGAAGIIDLPSLGSGFAQSGSNGATLVTDRPSNVPAYFASHWVRVTGANGVEKGVWRIAAIDAKTLTLSGASGIAPGDSWQGIYRFDALDVRDAQLLSTDPIEATSETLRGSITTDRVRAGALDIVSGATVTHLQRGSLDLDVTGTLRVESGALIDVSARGYDVKTTYPGARNVQIIQEGASHLGRGSIESSGAALTGATYGSIYAPRELGASGWRSGIGGGIVSIRAGNATIDGIIRANGGPGGGEASGAGGSIALSTATLSGSGTLETDGGTGCWAGGGGAIAVTYSSAGTTLPLMNARGGVSSCGGKIAAGPGSVYASGNATFDNSGRGTGIADLPALGR